MVAGDDGGVAAPYSHRRLVPLLASLVPMPPLMALRAITHLSVLTSYLILLWALTRRLQVGVVPATLAVCIGITSTRSLLMIQNPYLTDGFSFLMMSIMLVLFLLDRAGPFGFAAIVGVLAREDCLFGALSYLGTRRRAAGAAVALAALAVYAAPRWFEPHSENVQFLGFSWIRQPAYLAKVYFAFGFVWLVVMFALSARRNTTARRLSTYFVFALAGSMLSTLFAVDTTRMFLPVLPVAVVGCAVFLDRLRQNGGLLLAWLAVSVSNVGLALPNVLFPGAAETLTNLDDWYARLAGPIVVHQLGGIVLVWMSSRAGSSRHDLAVAPGNWSALRN
jgi:hypothetical protein